MGQEKKLLPIKRIDAVWIKVPKSDVSDIRLDRFKYKRKLVLVPYRYEKNWLISEDGKLTLDVKKYYKCHYCEECHFTEDEITKDHKNPQSKGGKDNVKNIVPACLKCNRDKADTSYNEYIRVLKARKKIQLNKLKIKSDENNSKQIQVDEPNSNNAHSSNNTKLQRKRPNNNSRK